MEKSPLTETNKDSQTSSALIELNMTTPWTSPTLLFVYGSLMDTDIIQLVLRLPHPSPTLHTAKLKDYRMKMWMIYPTLIPHAGSEVQGRVYPVETLEHFERLEKYETRAYTWTDCEVELDDGSVVSGCRVFVWSGDADSEKLREGTFDLEVYQKYHKPQMMGRPSEFN